MCPYGWMEEIGKYALIASPVAVLGAGTSLLAVALIDRDRRRAAVWAALVLVIPVLIMPIAALDWYITTMAHISVEPGLAAHAISAGLGVLALVTATGGPRAVFLAFGNETHQL